MNFQNFMAYFLHCTAIMLTLFHRLQGVRMRVALILWESIWRKISLNIKIPLYSAWVGSAWERLIRVIKSCIYKCVGRKKIEYFQFVSLLSDIQNTVVRRFVASLKNISNLLYFEFCDLNSLFHPYNLSRYLEIDIYTDYNRL